MKPTGGNSQRLSIERCVVRALALMLLTKTKQKQKESAHSGTFFQNQTVN